MDEMKDLAEKVEKGKNLEVPEAVRIVLDKGVEPYDVLVNGLQAGLQVVGARFKKGTCFIPEVLLAARAMHAGMDIIQPLIAEQGVKPIAKIVLGTVKDDVHDIGKNMVRMMLMGAGFEVVDVGINVSEEKFLEHVQKEQPDLLALSALLSTTMPYLKTTIDVLQENGVRDKIKILVGGAPVTEEYAKDIGADGFAPDSSHAVDMVKQLLSITT